MKAVVLERAGVLSYQETELPEVPAGSVRIRVAVCGICGSDIPRVFHGAAHGYPQILGHEFSGWIDALGADVRDLSVGQRVVAAPLVPCEKCPDCLRGDYALCSQYSFIGSRRPGAMADFVVVPYKNVLPISESISFEEAATVEPATVALHALRQCRFRSDKRVAVLGCGIIGLYMVQWAKVLGASYIAAVSRGTRGLNTARKLGADICVSTEGTDEATVLAALPEGFDYVMECSGSNITMQLALQLVANKGTVTYVGTPKAPLTFSIGLWEQINRKECWITGAWMSYSAPFPGEEWSTTIHEMETGKFRCIPELLYRVYPMKNAMEAFEQIHRGTAKGRVLLSNLQADTSVPGGDE